MSHARPFHSGRPVLALHRLSTSGRHRLNGKSLWGALLVAGLVAAGCSEEQKSSYTGLSAVPAVRVLQPPVRNIKRTVGQPSFVEAYERSSVYPKMTAYIEKWIVDIGDRVKKGDTLATLFVPELVEDFETKKAIVVLDTRRVERALKVVEVARADVEAARAAVTEATAMLGEYEAEVNRWDSEVKRLDFQVKRGVVDPQILLQSTDRWRSSIAARNAAKASVTKAKAQLLSRQAALAKAEVDVNVARADLAVAESEERRLEAWVGYLKLPAPYDGVIVARNANTFDFVLPSSGDPTAMANSVNLSPSGQAAPIYVVDRTDIVRVFVDVPEDAADFVNIGTKATVLIAAYSPAEIRAAVTRTSWALNPKTRTLRAEIDLPNTGAKILPGMYAYARVFIERMGVRAVPKNALTYRGDRTYCWLHENGRAIETEIQTAIADHEWVEVTVRRAADAPPSSTGGELWVAFNGSEEVITGDVSILTNGGPVRLVPAAVKDAKDPKAAGAGGAKRGSL